MKRGILVTVCMGLMVLGSSHSAFGRTTILSGSVGVQQEFESNIFRTDGNYEERWSTSLLPTLTLTSASEKDFFSVIANSDLWWDQTRDQRDFEHNLFLNGTREISQYLRLTIGNDYIYHDGSPEIDMDDTLTIEDRFARADERQREQVARLLFPEIEYSDEEYYTYCLSQIRGRFIVADSSVQSQVLQILSNTSSRRRSWENDFSISAEYEFARDSILEVGWSYYLLDDRDDYLEDYDEHSPYVSMSYRFHPEWRGLARYELTRTNNDVTDDERRHNTELGLEHNLTNADLLTANYLYESVDYDEDRDDWNEQTMGLGWDHNFGPHLLLNTTLEVNYLGRDRFNDERGITPGVGLTRTYQRGSVSLNGDIAFDERKVSGDWDKYRRDINLIARADYQLMENLRGNININYERRYFYPLIITDKEKYDDYEAGAGLAWTLGRWYVLSLNYTYDRLTAKDSPVTDYYEHTVMLQLTAAKDLLKW